MRRLILAALLAAGLVQQPAYGQSGATEAASEVVTVEYYYRVKWGALEEFKQLYAKNHAPLLEAMRREGFIRDIVMEEPFTHMAGGERWDLRVTITYRDAASAINSPRLDAAWEKAWASIYGKDDPEGLRFTAEEAKRFSLVEEHWDVIVTATR